MTNRLPTAVLALVVPAVAAVTAVVTLSVTSDSAPTSTGGEPTISIEDFEFGPDPVQVAPGTTITVVNRDDATHTVTSERDGAFDTGDIDGRDTTTIKVGDAGAYPYFCAIHDYMEGTIEVSR